MSKTKSTELEFPLECHFRVIAANEGPMQEVIESVARGLGITSPVTKANVSGKGKYISFNISTVVESREAMNRIDAELRRIQGVRMVL